MMFNIFPCAYWPFAYFLCKKDFSSPFLFETKFFTLIYQGINLRHFYLLFLFPYFLNFPFFTVQFIYMFSVFVYMFNSQFSGKKRNSMCIHKCFVKFADTNEALPTYAYINKLFSFNYSKLLRINQFSRRFLQCFAKSLYPGMQLLMGVVLLWNFVVIFI